MGRTSFRLLILVCVLSTGCIRPQFKPGPPTTTSVTQTPQYRIQQGLAILADTNLAATKTVIQLNKSGLLQDSQTRAILKYNSLVAQSAKSATIIMQSSRSSEEKIKAMTALMVQLPLPPDVKAFIDSGSSDELAIGAIASLTAVQSTIALVTANLGGLR